MKPSDSKERVRERVQRHRAGVTPPVTPQDNVTPLPKMKRPVTPQIFIQELSGDSISVPTRTKGLTPEECGYPEGQVDVRLGPQGQQLWRLNGHYDLPNRILCGKA